MYAGSRHTHFNPLGLGDAYDSDFEGKNETVHADYPKFADITNNMFPVDAKVSHLMSTIKSKG